MIAPGLQGVFLFMPLKRAHCIIITFAGDGKILHCFRAEVCTFSHANYNKISYTFNVDHVTVKM